MDDKTIIELYFERDERAIAETQKKYAAYCHAVAKNILGSDADAEECVNDTYLRAWNSIPPQRPLKLSTFLGRIARNLALDRYAALRAKRRYSGVEAVLDELSECLPNDEGLSVVDEMLMRDAVNSFLTELSEQTRIIFMQRYWYMRPVDDIAKEVGMSKSGVKSILYRTREKFKEHLQKEGISL